jgi:DNA-binding IclR family transcriptional regulator
MAAMKSRGPIALQAQPSATHHSVTRALTALETIAASHRALSLSELAEQLDAPKSSLHSILHALAARGYLEIDAGRNYRLGVRTMEIGSSYLSQVTPLTVAHPELVKLSHELHMTAHFAVLDGAEVLYLAKEDAPAIGIRLASSVGTRLPAHLTAVGKAILASVGTAGVALNLKQVGSSGRAMTAQAFSRELAQIRMQRYAVDEGETMSAVRCVAAPMFEANGRCCGAIGVSYLREGGPARKLVADAIVRAAARASQQLGAPASVA